MAHPEQWQAYAAWQMARGQRWPLPMNPATPTAPGRNEAGAPPAEAVRTLSEREEAITPAATPVQAMPAGNAAAAPAGEHGAAALGQAGMTTPLRSDGGTSDASPSPSAELVRKISLCRACSHWAQRRETLWGEGSLDAPVMFVGDHPEAGESGGNALFRPDCFDMLRRIAQAMRLPPEKVFYTNMVMCPPPPGQKLTMEAVLSCREHFISLLRMVKPKLIVTLGAEASASLSGQSAPFASFVGRWFSHPAFPQTRFMPVYHPRDMLAQAELKKVTWAALQEAVTTVAP